jgi:hypothetical protein
MTFISPSKLRFASPLADSKWGIRSKEKRQKTRGQREIEKMKTPLSFHNYNVQTAYQVIASNEKIIIISEDVTLEISKFIWRQIVRFGVCSHTKYRVLGGVSRCKQFKLENIRVRDLLKRSSCR